MYTHRNTRTYYKCLFLPQSLFSLFLLMKRPLYDVNKDNWLVWLSNSMSECDISVFHLVNQRFLLGCVKLTNFSELEDRDRRIAAFMPFLRKSGRKESFNLFWAALTWCF